MLVVNEIFFSIQGESSFAGRPCVFIRLTGCDLRCAWCDTAYAFHQGSRRSEDDVVAEVLGHNCDLVELTGGEPLLQRGVFSLMRRLQAAGKTVLLETGGHKPIDDVPSGVIRIIDVKCPGSGETSKVHWANLDRLAPTDEVKFVVGDRSDYEFAVSCLTAHDLARRVSTILFSPVHGKLHPKQLSEWILKDGIPVRLQLQLHKHIWSPETRGV